MTITTPPCEIVGNMNGMLISGYQCTIEVNLTPPPSWDPLLRMDSLRKGVNVVQKKIKNADLFSIEAAAQVRSTSTALTTHVILPLIFPGRTDLPSPMSSCP